MGSKNRKSSNYDEHGYGQKKMRPSSHIEGTKVEINILEVDIPTCVSLYMLVDLVLSASIASANMARA